MTNRTMQELTFYSEALQENISLLVYLPVNFSPLYEHMLVIAQDGKDYVQFGKVRKVLDELRDEEQIDPAIFVGIPYTDVWDRREKYHPEGAQHAAYIRFLAHELVPYLDEFYPTYEVGNGRVLLGDSLGGTISLLTALTYPHTFGKVIMQSPFVNTAVLEAAQSISSSYPIEMYHIIGTEETAVKTTTGEIQDFLTPNRELRELIIQKGLIYHYEEFHGDHTWKYWQKNLPHALSTMLTMK